MKIRILMLKRLIKDGLILMRFIMRLLIDIKFIRLRVFMSAKRTF